MDANPTPELEKSLQALSTSLQTPVVPGELDQWLDMVRQGAETAEQMLRESETEHLKQYEQIVSQDSGLGHRVAGLQEGDKESLTKLQDLKDCLTRLSNKADRKGPDEAAVKDDLTRCSDLGLQFVLHAQKQEIARKTWLHESFNRVRGGVD